MTAFTFRVVSQVHRDIPDEKTPQQVSSEIERETRWPSEYGETHEGKQEVMLQFGKLVTVDSEDEDRARAIARDRAHYDLPGEITDVTETDR